jgi:hypothetical protein
MSITSIPAKDGTPNGKAYALMWADDGTPYAYRGLGTAPQREFTLREAISIADQSAGEGHLLLVTDPETGTVLWTGEVPTR